MIGGILLSVVLVFQKTIFQQQASVATLSSFIVKGTVFVDTNTNGVQDSAEKNYTGAAKPLVRLALFAHVCSQKTPTPAVSTAPTPVVFRLSPTPTLAQNCHYGVCPKVACIQTNGKVVCPACAPVCTTPTPTVREPSSSANGKGQQVRGASIAPSPVAVSSRDVAESDSCGEKPVGVISCPVNPDGTYTCIANKITFSRATLLFNQPSGYEVTTHNNLKEFTAEKYQKDPSAIVNYGLAAEGTVTPPAGCFYKACTILCPSTNPGCCPRILVCATPTPAVLGKPSVTPGQEACIPRPSCLDIHQCAYPTPPQGWCSATGKPLTNDETKRLLIYLNTLLRKQEGK